jgi:hypothetical protein
LQAHGNCHAVTAVGIVLLAGETARNQGLAQPLHDSAMDLALEADRVHHRPDVNLPRGTKAAIGVIAIVGANSTRSGHPPVLLDDLVRAGEDRWRDRQTEFLRRLEVNGAARELLATKKGDE